MPTSASEVSGSGSSRQRAPIAVYELREHVDLVAAERMLGSAGMRNLKFVDEAAWKALNDTVTVARATGGYVTVQYYLAEQQEGFGRMKAHVAASGVGCVPFVRMRRVARAQLAASRYHDVDMVNCQPAILAQRLGMYAIPCPLLSRYVADREASIAEVVSACGVDRDAAKNLFVRLLFFGGVRGWLDDHPQADAQRLPAWLEAMRAELRAAAERLMELPDLAELKQAFARRPPPEGPQRHGNTLASQMAMYLQSQECDCVRALVDAVHASSRLVGGIIYDGVHVEREDTDADGMLPPHLLKRWKSDVMRRTGLAIDLAVKPFLLDPEWSEIRPRDTQHSRAPDEPDDDNEWMMSGTLVTYDETKARWEKSAFKVVNSGNYVRAGAASGARTVFSKRMLADSFEHLNYVDVKVKESSGRADVTTHPFIARWTRDSCIRQYMDFVLAPPPRTAPPDAYNIWSGFAVERYKPDEGRAVDTDSEAVRAFVDLLSVMAGRKPDALEYLLDWIAQIFQEPAVKRGIALLLRGEEGVGKNRTTDLLRLMMGADRFLQTASPSNVLYGRFTRLREGKLLVAINEANGADNFAANDVIKDMITCDEFVSEGKGTNAYSVACFARFIFTTNNDNCLKINPDSRRYVVLDASSEMKGDTARFNALSKLIDDEHGRFEFYKLLMARDISKVDWINSRPVTQGQLDMIECSMPMEQQFVKHVVNTAFHRNEHVLKMRLEELFQGFEAWLDRNRNIPSRSAGNSAKKFGIRLSKMVWTPENVSGFKGITKARHGAGVVYNLQIDVLASELVEKRWAAADEFKRDDEA